MRKSSTTGKGVKNYIRTRFEQLPSSLAQDSRTHGALLGLRCPECQPTTQFSQSAKRNNVKERRGNIEVEDKLQKQYDRSQHEFQAPAFQRCSSLASSCRLPCDGKNRHQPAFPRVGGARLTL